MSQNVYDQLTALSGMTLEYGFVVATKSATDRNAGTGDTLQYNGIVNGQDKRTNYAVNMVCSGSTVIDHYKDDDYRLYTAVITYNGEGYSVEEAKNRDFVARAYLRYGDANGLYRTHYSNYTGTNVYGGVCISYNGAVALAKPMQ